MIRGGEVNRHNGVTTRLARRWRFLSWLSVPCHSYRVTSARREVYRVAMQFAGTVLYVDQVSAAVDFYGRAFGLRLRFFDEALGFAELETGGSTLAIAAHTLGEMLMPGGYCRPVDGQPAVVEIAFLTRDVSASFAKAIAEGAVPITAPRRMPWGLEVAYVRAPEGTIIGFSEPPPAAQ